MEKGAIIFSGTREASRLTGIHHTSISATCRGKHDTAGGVTWSYL